MAFSDDDLVFLRESRFNRNQLIFVAVLATLALGIAGFFMGHDKAQPDRTAEPVVARPGSAAAPARTVTSRAPSETYAIQRERTISIQTQEKVAVAVGNEYATPAAPTPAAITATARSQRVQPNAAPITAPLPRERKVLTRAELDAELARRNEQNARDKAEIDRVNEEKEDAKQERMRLAEQQERKERLERLLQQNRTRRHIYITRRRAPPLQTTR